MIRNTCRALAGAAVLVAMTLQPLGHGQALAQQFASASGAVTWRAINQGLPDPFDSGVGTVLASPTDPNVIFAGIGFGVYRTTDGGAHWSAASTGLPGQCTTNMMAISPDGKTLYANIWTSQGGGLYRTDTGTINWGDLSNAPPESTIYSIYVDATTVYIGSYFSGIYRT